MAGYNQWQNASLMTAADMLGECERPQDRGHRGQIHAMLTTAGASPGRTDLAMLAPEDHSR